MAYLLLEDGTTYEGSLFGAVGQGNVTGEVVFNTGMTGYQEVLTDPSYCGQIVMMTYPLIGNYGVNWEDPESMRPQVRAFVVRELCEVPSNWHSEGSLNEYLCRHGILGIQGIDTRALTRKLRIYGTARGILCAGEPGPDEMARIKAYRMEKPVAQVTCEEDFEIPGPGPRVAVMDFGVKASILSSLRSRGCSVHVFPAETPSEVILADKPDGIMLTNGPGDPQENPVVIENLKKLIGRTPIFGICLGHQLLALACGARTERLRYGHRGTNHPVKDLGRDRVYITSQNHGFTVVDGSLPQGMVVTHRNWHDQTIEGIRYMDHPTFTVQFHPEASPGPRDSSYLFDEFIGSMADPLADRA